MAEWGYGSKNSNFLRSMEISGQVQVIFAPNPGKLLDCQHIRKNLFLWNN
jgi:hypothetical protein